MLKTLFIFGCYISTSFSQSCVENLNSGVIANGLRLVGHKIIHFQPSGLIMCAKECILYADCMSWNFGKPDLTCELSFETVHSKGDDVLVDLKWLYGLRDEWKHLVKGPCGNHTCEMHTKCVRISNGGYNCALQGCRQPFNSTLIITDNGYFKVGTSVSHQENSKKVHANCQQNGQWKYEEVREICTSDPSTPVQMTPISFNRSEGGYAVYECPQAFTGQMTYVCVAYATWKVNRTCGASWCQEPGYQLDLRLKICFHIFKQKKEYEDAVSFCRPGHLMTIDSQERHSFLEKTITSLNLADGQFIRIDGKRDNPKEHFKDHMGRIILFALQKLTNLTLTANCLGVVTGGSELTWHIVNCNDTLWYICQRDEA